MRELKPLIITLFILVIITQPVLAINDYGEDGDYLGQVVDDYTNEDFVQSKTNVINNETLDCMELNFTSGGVGPLYENFTTYTEVDSAADITKTDRVITWSTMRRDAASWVVYDFGANYFGDFQCNFTLDILDIEAGDSSSRFALGLCAFSNDVGTVITLEAGDYLVVYPRQDGSTDDRFRYNLYQATGGVPDFFLEDDSFYNLPNKHYLTFERSGVDIVLRVYSDEVRTVLVDTLAITGNTKEYRYFHVLTSYGTAADGADHSTGILANVTFEMGEAGGYSDGHYYTVDMLEGDTGLVLMYNATIPTGTGITVELSEDNSTWVDHNDIPGYDTLTAGFESLDLRDLNVTSLYMRFNMTNTNSSLTPRMYQIRLVTITEVELGEEAGDTIIMGGAGVFWILLIIIVPIVALVLFRRR